jgi:NAD(P)-dependent dehydrogenase (short-subunit alcohol dehydrogenase family)
LNRRVLVLGGYGVFGARVAAGLVISGWDVIAAGRSLASAQAHCKAHGGTPLALDRDAPDFATLVAALAPFAIVDAAGPFQAYVQPVVVKAALACKAHLLDLSDDAAFTAGISAFDAQARAAGITVLSGVSTVPALSSAVSTDLTQGMTDVHLIESTILPGNRAPRGLSVIKAILAQVGKPVPIWCEGPATEPGWGRLARVTVLRGILKLKPRWASPIGAPDLALFPAHFKARNVRFRAGLELSIMHLGLWALGWLVRLHLLRSLEPLAGLLQRAANLLKPFGTDQGGMVVRVLGETADGPIERLWTLIARQGDGPQIPAMPARLVLQQLAAGTVAPGARPAIASFTRAAAEQMLMAHDIIAGASHAPAPFLFAQALGPRFADLPPQVQALHRVMDTRVWAGEGAVTRGQGLFARIIAGIMRFPPASERVPVQVVMQRQGDSERWTRAFGTRQFHSTLRWRNSVMTERFGALRFAIGLRVAEGALHYPVTKGWAFGIPIPRALLPISQATETVVDGRMHFDVALSLPWIGPIVRYQGWLTPAS